MQYFLYGLQEARMGKTEPEWKELYRTYALDDEYRGARQDSWFAPRFQEEIPVSCRFLRRKSCTVR